MNCSRTTELTDEHIDGTLVPPMSAAFHRHLAGCGRCRLYVTELSTTVALLSLTEPEPPAAEVRTRLSRIFAEWAGNR